MNLDETTVRPCVHCGYCCRKTTCPVGLRVYGNGGGQCPALTWDGTGWFCKLMTIPGRVGSEYRTEIGSGTGCCSPLNSDRRRVPTPDDLAPVDYQLSNQAKALLLCLAGQWVSGDLLEAVVRNTSRMLNEPRFTAAAIHLLKEQRPRKVTDMMG